jgi:hydrogenase/urease accessory protein HupE
MKPLLRLGVLFSIGWMASVAPLWAHPGHDEDHGLVWDFNHLASHPLATLACVAVLTGAIWLGWQFVRRRTKVQPVSDAS